MSCFPDIKLKVTFLCDLPNFLSNPYIPVWLGIIFKFMVLKSLENAFASQEIESTHFTNVPRQISTRPDVFSKHFSTTGKR